LLKQQPFDIAVFAHTHRFKYVPKDLQGATFPVVNGDGPRIDRASVTILQKTGNKLHLKTLSKKPENCIDIDL
jgi:predicted phosphodiesterase